MSPSKVEPQYFENPAAFERWLQKHHDTATEIVVGFHTFKSGIPSLTWTESVRVALCYGWIDGVVRKIDAHRYTRRFTPRKSGSIWSATNIRHATALIASGHMKPAGHVAFEKRTTSKSAVYSFEQQPLQLPEKFNAELKSHPDAFAFWELQPRAYRQAVVWWIISAKQDATKNRRMTKLVMHSNRRERIPQFTTRRRPS